MARVAFQFEDPAGVKTTYSWPVNPSEEEEFGRERNIEHGAPTSGVGFIRQQGADSPFVFRFGGTIFHESQLQAMWEWFKLSRTQTVYLHDHAGDSYEVIIKSFKPVRTRTIRNPRDFANAPYHYWKYTIEMEVVRVIDGPIFNAGIEE